MVFISADNQKLEILKYILIFPTDSSFHVIYYQYPSSQIITCYAKVCHILIDELKCILFTARFIMASGTANRSNLSQLKLIIREIYIKCLLNYSQYNWLWEQPTQNQLLNLNPRSLFKLLKINCLSTVKVSHKKSTC